jgi:hypothetical protein
MQHISALAGLFVAPATEPFEPGRDQGQMTELLGSYLPIAIFIGIALVIGISLLVAPFIVAFKAPDSEKLSAYECGFNAFDDARMKFDIRFYLVSTSKSPSFSPGPSPSAPWAGSASGR